MAFPGRSFPGKADFAVLSHRLVFRRSGALAYVIGDLDGRQKRLVFRDFFRLSGLGGFGLLRGGLRLLSLFGHLSLFRDLCDLFGFLRGLFGFLGGRFRFLGLLLWQLLGHGFLRALELCRFCHRGQHQLGCQHQGQEQAQCSSSHVRSFLLFF